MKKSYSFALTLVIITLTAQSTLKAQQTNPLVSELQTDQLPRVHVNVDSLINTCTEIVAKRTPYSSYYATKDGQVIVRNSSVPINYLDASGKLQPIKIELKPNKGSWVADQQPNACKVNVDGSTGISIGNGREVVYNVDSKINGEWFSEQISSFSSQEVVLSMGADAKKRLTFKPNGIETDFIINKSTGKGITISEEVQFPGNCSFVEDKDKGREVQGKWKGNYLLKSNNGEVLAKFTVPLCYDAAGRTCVGYYQYTTNENGKHILKTIVPDEWLKNATYPVTVDPYVTGPYSVWAGAGMPTCFLPSYSNQDSMLVTIPGGITVTQFYIGTSIQSNFSVPIVYTNHSYIIMATSCGVSPTLHNPATGAVYSELFLGSYDFHNPLTCCYKPSCTDQTFWLRQENARDTLPAGGCDTNVLYYSGTPITFEAYIQGRTDTAFKYTLSPTKVCSNNCHVTLKATAEYGVPPYVLTHPWLAVKDTFGTYAACASSGNAAVTLTIPGCPTFCGKIDTVLVPPPVIVDACGTTALNKFTAQQLIINPTPKIVASPDSMAVCSGTPISFNITSCVAGTTINWTGSNSTSGSGSTINVTELDTTSAPINITYTATSVFNGCVGDTDKMVATINPEPTVTISPSGVDTVDLGNTQNLNATGGGTYAWTPATGLSCTNCANPVATPSVTTTYAVEVTNAEGCSKSDTVRLVVIDVTITIPNVFTPNGDGINDVFAIKNLQYHPNSKIEIYDRWGVEVYESNSYTNDWNGGNQSDGVYYYVLTLQTGKKYDGFFQIIK